MSASLKFIWEKLMFSVDNISSGYGSTQVLRGVTLNVEDSSIVAILGRNGVGKTTLLKTIIGLVPITTGKISINNVNLTHLPAHQRVRRGISYVPQGREIFASLSVRENIISGQYGRKKSDDTSIEWLLDIFPMLKPKLNERSDRLSGGQQQ